MTAYFVARFAQDLKRSVPTLDEGVVAHLQGYAWPGNVRELEHLIHRAVLLCEDGVMRVEDVSLPSVAPPAGDGEHPPTERRTGDADEAPPVEEVDEKQQILAALQATHWRIYGVHGAAALLGMHPESCVTACRNTGYDAEEVAQDASAYTGDQRPTKVV